MACNSQDDGESFAQRNFAEVLRKFVFRLLGNKQKLLRNFISSEITLSSFREDKGVQKSVYKNGYLLVNILQICLYTYPV
jgi:hypothetical protein